MKTWVKKSKTVKSGIMSMVWGMLILFGLVSLMATDFSSDTYDTATPAGSDSPTEADDRMREIKSSVRVRENVDHYWPLTGTEVSDADVGEHRFVTFQGPNTTPATVAENKALLYTKDVSDKAELHWIDEDEQELVVTSAGKLLITESRIANDSYLKAIDNAGTGTVNLIKADTNDVAVLPDDSQTATSGAPTFTKSIVNKKYVDDNSGSANYDPTTQEGESESVGERTSPDGFQEKWGKSAFTHNSTAYNYFTMGLTDFANACFQVQVTGAQNIENLGSAPCVTITTTTGFTVYTNNTDLDYIYWRAIGR